MLTPTKRALESSAPEQKPAPKRRPKGASSSSSSVSPAPPLLSGDQWLELLQKLKRDAADDNDDEDVSRQWHAVDPPKTKTVITLIRIAKCNLLPDQWKDVVRKLEEDCPRLQALSRDPTRYRDLLTDINAKEEKHLLGLLFTEEYKGLILAVIKALKCGQGHAFPVLAAVLTVYWGRLGEHQVTLKETLTYFGRMEKRHGYCTTDHFWEWNGGKSWPIEVTGRKREGPKLPSGASASPSAAAGDAKPEPGKPGSAAAAAAGPAPSTPSSRAVKRIAEEDEAPRAPGPEGQEEEEEEEGAAAAAAAAAASPAPSTPFSSVVKQLGDTKLATPAHQQTGGAAAGAAAGSAKPEASGLFKGSTVSPIKRIAEEDETPRAPGPAEGQEEEEEEGEGQEGAAAAAASPAPSTPFSSVVKQLGDAKLETPAHQQTAGAAAGAASGSAQPEEKLPKHIMHITNSGGASGPFKGSTVNPIKRIAEEDEMPRAPGPQGQQQQEEEEGEGQEEEEEKQDEEEKNEGEGQEEEESLPSSQPGFAPWGGTRSSPPREWAAESQDPITHEGLSQPFEDMMFPVEPLPLEVKAEQQQQQRWPNGCNGSSRQASAPTTTSTTVGAVSVPSDPALLHLPSFLLHFPAAPCAGLACDYGVYQSYQHQQSQQWETDLCYADPCSPLAPLPDDEPWHDPLCECSSSRDDTDRKDPCSPLPPDPLCQCFVCECLSSRDDTLFEDLEISRYMFPGLDIYASEEEDDDEDKEELFLEDFLKDEPFEDVAKEG